MDVKPSYKKVFSFLKGYIHGYHCLDKWDGYHCLDQWGWLSFFR